MKKTIKLYMFFYIACTACIANDANTLFFNSSFENGESGWESKLDSDYSKITVEYAADAPDGNKVLHFSHQRTRSSSIQTTFNLKPRTYYLASVKMRADPFLRSGMGIRMMFFADGREFGFRKGENEIDKNWQTYNFPVLTGNTGASQVTIQLHETAGEVWVDKLDIQECQRDDLVQFFSNAWEGGIPRPMPDVNSASVRVWCDEIPVPSRPEVPSWMYFHIDHRMDEKVWKQSGRFFIELPDSVHMHNTKGVTIQKLDKNRSRYTVDNNGFYFYRPGQTWFCMIISLKEPLVGDRLARFWVEWQGGKQEPVELQINEFNLPAVQAPKKLIAGTCVYGSVLDIYSNYPTFISSLGFNHLESWGSGVGKYNDELQSKGITMTEVAKCPGEYIPLFKDDQNILSLNWKGQRSSGVMCLSHKGAHTKFIDDIQTQAENGLWGLQFDDETYNDWGGMDGCVCASCQNSWRDWLLKNRPGLSFRDPVTVLDDPINNLEHYNAWWYFRANQLTEWYRDMQAVFRESIAKTSLQRRFVMSAGTPGLRSVKSQRLNFVELSDIFDCMSPQYYTNAENVGKKTRELVSAVGRDKACPYLCPGERFEWRPGEFRAQILEVVFAGGNGYLLWGWPYSNLRIIAEAAEANGALAKYEQVFLHGTATDSFYTQQSGCRVSVIESDKAGLLLVSKYRGSGESVSVRRKSKNVPMLTEVFTGKKLFFDADSTQIDITVSNGTSTLWMWKK